MKKLLTGLLLLLPSFGFCDQKISGMTSTTTLNSGDIIPVVTNPSTTPANRVITFQNFSAPLLTTSSATATYLQINNHLGTNGAKITTAGTTQTVSVSSVSLSTQVVGNLPVTNLNSGTNADSSHFWRGDGLWISSSTFGSSGPTLASTQTWTGTNTFSNEVNISSGLDMNSQKITRVANGTVGTDAATFGQIQSLAAQVQTIVTSNFSTTANTFQTTNLSASITPSSASSRVKITVIGVFSISAASAITASLSIFRGNTNLAVGTDTAFAKIKSASGQQGFYPTTVTFIDSPLTSSATTYAVKIKNSDNANTIEFGQNEDQIMTLEEIR